MFYTILSLISIVAGIICILTAFSWNNRTAKVTFILFVLFSFVVPGFLSLIQNFIITLYRQSYSSDLDSLLQWIQVVFVILSLVSLVLLVIFTINVRNLLEPQAAKPIATQLTGPSWNTDLDSKQRTQISTKRNLAFVVDYMPILLALVCYAYYLTNSFDRRNVTIAGIVFSIGSNVMIVLCHLYLVLKDIFRGQSFGKRLLGCRVVSVETGQPVGSVDSALRNLILVLPLAPLVELLVSMVRPDKKRLGDLLCQTQVVTGPPQFIDGVPVVAKEQISVHPLDAE